jgi:hypothetical protein
MRYLQWLFVISLLPLIAIGLVQAIKVNTVDFQQEMLRASCQEKIDANIAAYVLQEQSSAKDANDLYPNYID